MSKAPSKVRSLELYDTLKWTIRQGTSPMDAELRDNWETIDWEVLDLALVMDCTGSMEAWIDNCKTTLSKVIDKIVAQNPKLKVRVAFVGYRDFTDYKIFAIHDFTFDIDVVKGFISSRGGQRWPGHAGGRGRSFVPRHAAVLVPGQRPAGFPRGRRSHPWQQVPQTKVVKQLLEMKVDLTLYKLNNTTEMMYRIMEQAGHNVSEEVGISFVDLRREVTESRSRGLELSGEFMSEAYARKSSEHMTGRCTISSRSSSRSTNPSR